ncbi:hypothetical protein BN1708_015580 [Verticillium longisporum]|uniref:F-box domain-containing protein n=1 Tax=Verticillium longisporum TaxID=100787 RepID=A0A0G4M621_VERLO|nr:hypothetical protein BN1708_015580 [Verticillium longisporum]
MDAAEPQAWQASSSQSPRFDASLENEEDHGPSKTTCHFVTLPAELLDAILSHLSPIELALVAGTCRHIHLHATADRQWLPRVQANVPGLVISSPYPCRTFRELYGAHDPHWFLPKHKIWFCDRNLMGKIIVVRYDPRRGCIEGYQLLAVGRRPASFQPWPANNDVLIHEFRPQVKLHLDKPILQFHVGDDPGIPAALQARVTSKSQAETPMMLDNHPGYVFSNFSLARPVSDDVATEALSKAFPYDCIWPPKPIPAEHRVAGFGAVPTAAEALNEKPQSRAEASDRAFRIRQWMDMANYVGSDMLPPIALMPPRGPPFGPHIGEEINTYSTLDPALYTPTTHKPWRGIWVGDYSGHGCEFLLINQPDDKDATDEELGLARNASESDEDWAKRQLEARVYRGRLEAIKLTGDANVPRGEYTFVAEDLGPEGSAGVATEEPFVGARIVKSRGHVADTGYFSDKYIASQLFLISPNRLAQFWVDFGHISYFERVNIDSLLTVS